MTVQYYIYVYVLSVLITDNQYQYWSWYKPYQLMPLPLPLTAYFDWLFRHWSYAWINRVHVKWQLYWGAGHMFCIDSRCVDCVTCVCQIDLGTRPQVTRRPPLSADDWSKHQDPEGRMTNVPHLKQAIFKGARSLIVYHHHPLAVFSRRYVCVCLCVWSCVMWPCRDSVMLWGKKPGSFCWDISPGTARWRSGKSCTEPKRTTTTAISHTQRPFY